MSIYHGLSDVNYPSFSGVYAGVRPSGGSYSLYTNSGAVQLGGPVELIVGANIEKLAVGNVADFAGRDGAPFYNSSQNCIFSINQTYTESPGHTSFGHYVNISNTGVNNAFLNTHWSVTSVSGSSTRQLGTLAGYGIAVYNNGTGLVSQSYPLYCEIIHQANSRFTTSHSIYTDASIIDSSSGNILFGNKSLVSTWDTSHSNTAIGFITEVEPNNTSIIKTAYGLYASGVKSKELSYGVRLQNVSGGTAYGVYIDNVQAPVAANAYALYTNSGNIRLGGAINAVSGADIRKLAVGNAADFDANDAAPIFAGTNDTPLSINHAYTNSAGATVFGSYVTLNNTSPSTDGANIYGDYSQIDIQPTSSRPINLYNSSRSVYNYGSGSLEAVNNFDNIGYYNAARFTNTYNHQWYVDTANTSSGNLCVNAAAFLTAIDSSYTQTAVNLLLRTRYSNSGIIKDAYGLYASGILARDSAYGIRLSGVSAPIVYGIYIDNIASTQHAIYTNSGRNQFGGPVILAENSFPLSGTAPGTSGQIAVSTTHFYWHNGTQWLRVSGSTF